MPEIFLWCFFLFQEILRIFVAIWKYLTGYVLKRLSLWLVEILSISLILLIKNFLKIAIFFLVQKRGFLIVLRTKFILNYNFDIRIFYFSSVVCPIENFFQTILLKSFVVWSFNIRFIKEFIYYYLLMLLFF